VAVGAHGAHDAAGLMVARAGEGARVVGVAEAVAGHRVPARLGRRTHHQEAHTCSAASEKRPRLQCEGGHGVSLRIAHMRNHACGSDCRQKSAHSAAVATVSLVCAALGPRSPPLASVITHMASTGGGGLGGCGGEGGGLGGCGGCGGEGGGAGPTGGAGGRA
jgi:hypothetical protein